ncbi:hypothetical protein [Streptomyces hydrogenans]|uniref:hypothetical protein n=1 Tax=Streptomyces hydrogenans TaxID=1873719 RepID=UPI0035E24EC0
MKYTDREGDTWETFGRGQLKCVERVSGNSWDTGGVMDRAACEERYGPLLPADVSTGTTDFRQAVRAEVANVLEELASEAHSDYVHSDGTEERIAYYVHRLLSDKVQALRGESR